VAKKIKKGVPMVPVTFFSNYSKHNRRIGAVFSLLPFMISFFFGARGTFDRVVARGVENLSDWK
jgi:hypothetical protein